MSVVDDPLEELRRRDEDRLERLNQRDREAERAPADVALFGGGNWPDDETRPVVRPRSELRPALGPEARRRRKRWEKRRRRESRRLRRRERRARRREREAITNLQTKGEVKVSNSMFDSYLQYRAEGIAPKPAAELAAALYGKNTAEEVRQLQVTLEALEDRDRPPGAGEPMVKVPAGVESLYLSERRAGRSDADATRATAHSYQYDPVQLERQLERPREQFRRELEAWTPRAESEPKEEAHA
jgi:hypothetical protein